MRIRSIKPEIWSHPVMGRLDDAAKWLAIALLNYADDEGYFRADPVLVRAAVAPFIEDSMIVQRTLTTLEKVAWIETCDHPEQGRVGRIVNFRKHQQIQRPRPSKLATYFNTEKSLSPQRSLNDSSLEEQGAGNREQGTGSRDVDGVRHPSNASSATSDSTHPAAGSGDSSTSSADSGKKKKGGPGASNLVDEEHLAKLRPLFREGEVDRAWARMQAWLLTPKGSKCAPTKRRFLTFLRDAEPVVPGGQKKETPRPADVEPAGWQAIYPHVMGEPLPEGMAWRRLPPHTQRELRAELEKEGTR